MLRASCVRYTAGLFMVILVTFEFYCFHSKSKNLSMTDRPKCTINTRRQHLRNVCHKRGWSSDLNASDPHTYWRLLVDDDHNVLYCVIPKVACSSFKTFIAKATKRTTWSQLPVHSKIFLNTIGLGYMDQSEYRDTEYRIENYHKFLAVRHPFDRLASAYRDKFIVGKYYPKVFRDLFTKVYKDQLPYDQFGIVRPTFSQFLGLVARFYYAGFNDRHWCSYYDLCHPCNVQYDDIIKLETLGDDLHTFTDLYKKSHTDFRQVFPDLNNRRNQSRNKLSETTKLFSEVHPTIIKRLLEIYEKDLVLFGYSWSSEQGAVCNMTTDEQIACC